MRIWIEVGLAIVLGVLAMAALAWGLHFLNELIAHRCVREAVETACYVGVIVAVASPFAAAFIYVWAVRRWCL